ncbi:costars domain-containing protein [Pterulicium gracile]|uniref:Costars domain-containing protein n=1 Tax=Pterulicium gracile TaxID=1884261 RepID=A0A5C3R438_9AGAR|nr:costars domain-containing protein [Pterula gracilis]
MINTSDEQQILKRAIATHGSKNDQGQDSVAYGVLFEKTAQELEALNGTLRSAKRQKLVAFDQELLMMPRDKDVQVVWIGA